MRNVEDHVLRKPGMSINVRVPTDVALYILNGKRMTLSALEQKYGLSINLVADDHVGASHFAIERGEARIAEYRDQQNATHVRVDTAAMDEADESIEDEADEEEEASEGGERQARSDEGGERSGRRRRRRRGRGGDRGERSDSAVPRARSRPPTPPKTFSTTPKMTARRRAASARTTVSSGSTTTAIPVVAAAVAVVVAAATAVAMRTASASPQVARMPPQHRG